MKDLSNTDIWQTKWNCMTTNKRSELGSTSGLGELMFPDIHKVLCLPESIFFNREPVASKFCSPVLMALADGTD